MIPTTLPPSAGFSMNRDGALDRLAERIPLFALASDVAEEHLRCVRRERHVGCRGGRRIRGRVRVLHERRSVCVLAAHAGAWRELVTFDGRDARGSANGPPF